MYTIIIMLMVKADLLLRTSNGKFAHFWTSIVYRARACDWRTSVCVCVCVERSGEIKGLQKVVSREGERVARLNAIGCSVPCNWIRFGATTTATTTSYVYSHYRCILRYGTYRGFSLSHSQHYYLLVDRGGGGGGWFVAQYCDI